MGQLALLCRTDGELCAQIWGLLGTSHPSRSCSGILICSGILLWNSDLRVNFLPDEQLPI